MINIILDTNIWISHVAKDIPAGLISQLKEKIDKHEINLLTNQIILDEWARNKERTIKDVANNIKSAYQSAKKLEDFLQGKEQKVYHDSLTSAFSQEQSQIDLATKRVEETEKMLNACQISPITDEMKLTVAGWALDKRAPFKKKANSVGDALILLSSIEHCKVSTIGTTDSIFVSFNHDDYTDGKDIDKIHDELGDLMAEANMTFTRNIGEALQMAPKLIEAIDDYIEWQIERNAEDYDFALNR
jgi:predicted nucleic acid-binding protein